MVHRFVKWFKIRFVFSDDQLALTLQFLDRVNRERLNDESLWDEVQYTKMVLACELARRKLARRGVC